MIIKTFKRMFAFMLSIVTAICCFGAIRASAVNVNSGLAYELWVEKIGDHRVILHIDFTKNPGIELLSFAVDYDDKCTMIESNTQFTGLHMNQTVSNANKCAIYDYLSTSPYNGKISIDIYFNTSDSANNAHEFSTAIRSCVTTNPAYDVENDDGFDISVNTGALYTVGDVNGDAVINIQDASAALDIAQRTGGTSVSVAYANSILSQLRIKYPKMVCAESADVDLNQKINKTDANLILSYYSNESVGNLNIDTYIGTKYYKMIVA